MMDVDNDMTPTAECVYDHDPLYNPLDLDLKASVKAFQSLCLEGKQEFLATDLHVLQTFLDNPASVSRSTVLDTLSKCMLNPSWTLHIVKLFRPIAIDLVARWVTPGFTAFLDDTPTLNRTSATVHKIELVAKAFSIVLPILPQVKSFTVTYFTHSPSLFERLNQSSHDQNDEDASSITHELQDLLLTAYRLLSFSTVTFSSLWNWGPIVELLNHRSGCIRYLSILCLAKVYGLSDAQTKGLLQSVTGCSDESDEPLMTIIDGQHIDIRFIRLWEQQRLADAQIALTHNAFISDSVDVLHDEDLSPLTVNLCGVLLPKTKVDGFKQDTYKPQMVLTKTTTRNLYGLSLALSIGAPTLLEGVTGAGKTALVEELAIRTGRGDQLVKIHLGDQTDPKVLLGTYVSTSTPGSFRWQEGVLTTAVQEGRWVLIEDIDLAPAEVISVLLPLLETRQLFIPSRGEKIKAKEGFQLFGTRSFVPSRSGKGFSSRGGDLVTGANLWTRIHVDPLSMEELELVVRQKFSHIGGFSTHVMRLFETVINIYQDPNFSSLASSTMGRYISTRDLMKWCHRIDTLLGSRLNEQDGVDAGLDETVRQDLFSEAIDCFCGMIPDYTTWVVVLEKVGEPLQISQEMVRLYVDQYKPLFEITDTTVRVGRVNLSSIVARGKQKQKEALIKRERKRPFAKTGHALRLLEKIAVSVHLNEPVLLVGETGTGKTTVVQHLADMMHQNLIVVNLSQQSDSSDLLGGFKPVDGKVLAIPMKEDFERLFERTFSMKKNAKFLAMVHKMFVHTKWVNFIALLKQAVKMSQQKFEAEQDEKSKKSSTPELRSAWKLFSKRLEEFEVQQAQSENKFVFNFMEGSLVKAVRRGDWILLDEINLATTETLECLSGLLQDAHGSLLLTEKGDVEPIQRHPNFRLFACMNPATDVGKRDLPPGLRNRFTEFYVHPPDARYEDLLQIVRQYLANITTGDERACPDVAEFYMEAKKLAGQHKLVDGANQRPHFSMRTLARALTYVVQIYPTYGLRRSLFEGFCMTFLTQLSKESEALMKQLIHKTILRGVQNPTQLVTQIPRQPAGNFIQFGYFWLEQGQFEPQHDQHYILTPSVETKLYNLARVIMSRKFPVLIQGPTSAGKTSMIEYMAKETGHRFVRINNHEHTDLQEYLGTYVSNAEGKLVFQEGVLVEALRNGYWIVLDELNLAPSDVLEALNRLLDDNRELLIPETQEIVKPHPHFMLFATQNPAGLYGGRKALSRAFRNRFLELHFDDIPQEELETILSKRCSIAPSYCKKLVQVYKSLMERRQSTRIFEQKHGFITLRDLFRWAGRDPNGYQELAEHGYMLLAERCRKDEEKQVVKQVLETVMKVKLNENEMYDCTRLEEFAIYDEILKRNADATGADTKLVWTKAMRRLFSLVARCLRYKEPVLLVGETGCGKTTVCQMLAETFGRELHIVNCHQNTETGDLLGGQRPVRNHDPSDEKQQLFEWHDGPLVQSLREGHLFLLDEISLADDSVLERLNSVLEPSRLLVLAEKGGKHVEELYGQEGFQFLATMNPGGDYGKKELSPALRNRFTEIWVPAVDDREDLLAIITEQMVHADLKGYAEKMLDFITWYTQALGQARVVVSLRDILSWVKFMNAAAERGLSAPVSFTHGGCLVLLDGLGSHGSSGSFLAGKALKEFRLKCLQNLANAPNATEKEILGEAKGTVEMSDQQFAIGPFAIDRGTLPNANIKFTLLAPTTADNAMRVIRAMQLKKPILLEGSPGVGKTSLISALAAASGHNLVRINLSEQTDLMDLFGSDLPVEGGNSGEFAWRDAPFLQAMKAGDWVLLDELNLASQSVLEGLNSCLDHRGAVYIPELDREFFCAKEFRVFGAQNPLQQGGGRKGLPKSFVNRFTQVYVEHLSADDLLFICAHLFPEYDTETLQQMIEFNTRMYEETMIKCSFGRKGSPWEFNLRDVFRWLELMRKDGVKDPAEYLDIIYMQRMRTHEDRLKIVQVYESVFQKSYERPNYPPYKVTPTELTVGHSRLTRGSIENSNDLFEHESHLLQSFLPSMEALIKCVESSWMAILTGPSASGKTSLIRLLSKFTGNKLEEFAMNNSVDTMELLGGFEQVDLNRHSQLLMDMLHQLTDDATKTLLMRLTTLPDQEQRAQTLRQIRQLSDTWFVLENKQSMQQNLADQNNEQLDYALVSNVLNCLNAAVGADEVARKRIEEIVTSVKKLQLLQKDSVAGKFEWIDGLLINALEKGHWLLIDNANMCNPSVLDRLNPLFENDGVLMVNERGLVDGAVKVIKPHPNFRMFMTVDPQNGELSRAMRNRGIEIALVDSNWNENVQDATTLANGLGLRGPQLPLLLNQLQGEAIAARKQFGKHKNVRDYLLFATYTIERLQRGQTLKAAVSEAFHQVFVDIKEAPEGLQAFMQADSEADLLQVMVSPANCPYFVGGSLFQEDSALATITLQGAYLLSLLQTAVTDDDNAIVRQIEVAADYFVEAMSLKEFGLRLRWVAYLAQHASVVHTGVLERLTYTMKSLRSNPVTVEWMQLQSMNELDATQQQTLAVVEKAYALLIRLTKQEYAELNARNASQKLKLGNLSVFQQSYCYHEGRLSDSQLLHPVVTKLYPLYQSIHTGIMQWIDQAAYRASPVECFNTVEAILDARDYAWTLTQSHNLNLDNLLIILRWMKQSIASEAALAPLLATTVTVIDGIMAGFDFETCKSMKALWKYFSPATLASESLHQLEAELLKTNKMMDAYQPNNEQGLTSRSLVFTTPLEVKEALTEGLATLYAIDNSKDNDALKIAKSLKHLPEYIRRQLEATTDDASAKTNVWDSALIPLLDYSSIAHEMELLTALHMLAFNPSFNKMSPETLQVMRQFHHNCLEKTSRPPQDAVAYQRLIWLLDSPDCDKLAFALPSLLQDATRTWYQRMWRASIFQQNLYQLGTAEVDLGISEGPLSLFQSVETMACLNILSSVDKISVDAYGSALQQLKSLKEYLAVNVNAKDKRCLEIIMLVSMSRQLLNAGAELMDTNVYQTVCERLDQLLPLLQGLYESNMYTVARLGALYGQALVVLDQMITVLQQVKFSALFVDAISNILQAIQHYRNGDDAMFYTTAGKSRVLLGLTFLTSYIPDYPVDPTSEPRLRVNLLLKKQQEYSDSIDVRTKIEDIATGNHTNAAIRSSEVKLAAVNEELAQSSTTFSLRPEKSQLEDIFVDLRYLQKSMLDHNVEQLLKDLQEHGADSVLQRENLVQGNALQFIERVHSKFPLYRDVLQPLIVAVGDIKYGLRIMTSARRSDKLNENLACITELLVRNPDVGRRARDLRWHTVAEPASLEQVKTIIFNRSSTSRKWMFYLRFLIVVLQRLTITINSHGYIQAQDLTAINGLCSEVVRVWKEAQEYKRQQEAEKESMYKTRAKKYEPLTEEELDEADMKKMFANFNDDFADLTIDDQQQGTEPVSAAPGDVEEESVLDDIDIQRIGRLHEVIFSTYHQDACLRTDNTWDREAWQSYNIAGQLRSMSTSAFDLATDFVCNAGHLRMASLALRRLETEDSFAMTSDDIYDFYTSENIAEAKRVQPIIYRFKARVQQIASEWPEHAILEQLINISDRLLGFSIVSPVAKFLIGVELLLQKSEDWEAYAAKHVSLKEQREELIALIVRWRQLELNCWPKLLAAQEQYSQNAAFQWWFHLYDAVNNTSFQSGAEEDDKKKTQELLQALDHFIQSASLIEFEPRLTMINSFYRQSKVQAQLACSAEEKANHSTAATILRNVYLYYSQFKDHARTMLAQLRKPIEKELKEFVKIASWKDVNIYALRQSAQKTHRQLHKCIRKYREVLNNSMLTVIANYNQEHAMFQYGDEKRYNADIKHGFADQLGRSNLWLTKTSIPVTESVMNLDESVALKKHLANLPATLNRMRSYCGSDLFVTAEQQKELPLETFMTNIIQQIKEFQKETPAIMTDENKSLVKNQKLLKKKALVDFLKELRRLGLKWRAGTLVEQNADTSALFRQHVASLDAITQSRGLQKEPLSTYSVVSQDMIDLWNKANDYYYRCIARLTHLRTISTTQVSKDLSLLEVERSMSATEHMFSLVLKERTILSRMEERILVLQGFSVQMAAVYDATTNNKSISANTSLGCRLTAHKMAIDDLVSMLTEALATFTVQAEYDEVIRSMVVRMQAICTTVQKIQKATDNCYVQRYLFPRASTDVDVALLSEDVVEMMDMQCQTVREIESSLIEIVDQAQQSSHIIYPIIQSIESIRTDEPNSTVQNASDDISVLQLQQKVHSVIDAILVAVQDLKKSKSENDAPAASKEPSKEEEEEENDADDMPENYIRLQHQKQHALATALHTDLIARRCVEILNLISPIMNKANEADASSVSREISRLLQQVYPFVQQYMLVVQHTLGEIVLHHKSMAKLTYALINSFSVIISKGFCMPEGAADEEEGDADGTATGTGIGEGEGTKDVTEEIEDEEQVLGTQNEEQRKDEKQDTKEEKNGMEMENDFDGTLEDVEPDENEDQDQEEDSEDEEEELDDEIGDVDDMDPDAVDDKMWGEEGEENLNESDKTVDQAQPQGPKEADIVAKEEEEQQDPSKQGEQPEKSEEPQREEQRDQQNEDEQGEGEGEDMEEEDEEGPENRPGDQFNAEVPEAETLDLPDDMNLDGDEDQEGGDNEQEEDFFDAMDTEQGGEGDQMEEDEEDENEKYDDPLDHIQEGEADDAQAEDEEMADTTAQMEKDETGEDEMKTEGEEEKEEVENEEQQPVGDAEQGGGTIEEEEDEESALDNKAQNREQPNSDATADNQFGVQGEQGKASMSSTGQKEGENEASETAEADMKQDERSEEKGAAQRGANQAQQEDETGDNEEEKAEPSKANPQRSLGDALESWRRRLADVADAEDEDEEEATDDQQKQDETKADEAQVNEDHAFEYVKNDEEAHDMQTMSNAAADQVQDLKMGAMDEEMEDTEQHAGESEDVQPTDPEVDTMPLARDTLEMSGERDMGGAILSKQLPNERSLEEPDVLTVDESVVAHQPLEEEDIERMRDELETKVSEWRGEGRDINKARELWQGYENLTHDLAMGLCEQLRLILEPTLATKLKGDYRTGKRLNMKKIIPYIASQFKKDKIWLRRTKPSKRQYQVMISVDDSKSMSESHSVQLAYETLSLISKALSQLEVGDISIVSFGERIRLLHPFDQPFTSESGAQVLRQFTFAQQKTYVKNLVETSISLFENSKRSSGPGNAELWQLQLIISDGICEDHDTLKALVRRAMENQIMIIFIVVDNKPEKDSILNMTNVKYTTVNGKLSLQMTSYLETFPFNYFMVLRDINSLPEALSDALRQYFSFVAA